MIVVNTIILSMPVLFSKSKTQRSSFRAGSLFLACLGVLLFGGWTRTNAQGVPLATALDAEGLSFSASSAEDVFGQENANGGTDDGVFLRDGGTLTAAITGPAELYWTKSSGSLTCRVDGLEVVTENAPGADDDRVEIPSGQHLVSWTAKPGPPCWMYSVMPTPSAPLSPETALGSAGLTWQASPEISFFSSGDGAGLACLFLPQAPVIPRLYGLETTVTGPGVISLRSKMRTSGKSRLHLDGIPYALESFRYWGLAEFCVPPGAHTITIAPPAPTIAGAVAAPVFLLLDEASWQPQSMVPLAEALDAPELTFTTGGGSWLGVSENGTDFARAANLLSNQSAWIETTVTGPGLLSFNLSTTGNDYSPKFLLDGVAKSVSVNTPGSMYGLNSVDIPAGAHTLRWTVSQPNLYNTWLPAAGNSAALDAVSWQPFNPQPIATWTGGSGFSLTASAHDWKSVTGPDRDGGGSLHPFTVSGELAWLEATVTGPAAFEFSIYAAGENRYSSATVTLDGVRSLDALPPDFLTGWTEHLLSIPEGPHTVRWTLPSDRPLIWLDRFRLTPAGADFGAAMELPGATWTPAGERQWFAVSKPDLPDGDAIAVESGFYWNEYLYPRSELACSISGPGSLTLRAHSVRRPVIVLDDIFTVTPATWSDESNGWSATTFTLPPGMHRLSVSPRDNGPLLLDRAEWTPSPGPSFADVFPLPGVTWRTSPDNAFHGFADPGVIAQPSAILRLALDAPEGWLEAALTGPGTFSFSAQAFGDIQSFRVLVDDQPIAAVEELWEYCDSSTIDFAAGSSTASRRYSLSLPAGPHTIHWIVPAGSSTNYAQLLVLHSMTFAAESAFSAASANNSLPFVHGEIAPQALTDADGTPFVRVPSAGPDPWGTGCSRRLLSSRTTAPGFFKFRYRSAPGNWQQNASCYVGLWHPEVSWEAAGRMLTFTGAWREVELFVPDRAVMVQWAFPGDVAGLDFSAFTFTPVTPVPLDAALGIPGTVMTTNPDRPWKGWRSTDGTTFVTPQTGQMNGFPRPWMEAAVSGPALLSWNYWLEPGQWPFWEELDGGYVPVDSVPRWPIPHPLSAWELVIPAGAHRVLWAMPQMPPGSRTGIEGMRIRPLPASYAEWRPPLPGGDPWNRPGAPGPSADYDLDGLTNLEEFTWQTDPFGFTLPPQPVSVITAGYLTVCVPAPRPLSDGVRVYFESSGDLTHWRRAATELQSSPPAGQVKYRFTDPVSSSPRFFLHPRVEFIE